jgi:hypothetical protein
VVPNTILCPFCFAEIDPQARKCCHCGEWLQQAANRAGSWPDQRGTASARAVTRGIKQYRLDNMEAGLLGILAFIPASVVGYYANSVIFGLLVWGIFGYFIGDRYLRE